MSIRIKYHREGDIHTIETGNPAIGTIRIDQTGVPEEQRGGTAKQLLCASALFCYCAALDSALISRGALYSAIDAVATLETGTNDKGLGRILSIDLKTEVTLSEDEASVFERCQKILRQGCLVTSSLRDGIETSYSVEAKFVE